MKVTNEKTENHQVYLLVEMEQEEVEKARESAYRRMVKQVNIPGFRKGKAPRAVLERYVGSQGLVNEMLEELAPHACEQAIEEEGVEAFTWPSIEIVEREPVVFRAIVPLKPVVRLGDYRAIRVEAEEVEVTEEMVDRVIEDLRHAHAIWEPVERPVQLNDMVTIDVVGTIQGETHIDRAGVQYQVMAGSSAPVPGFAEELVGMVKGEEKEFQIRFPEDYTPEERAGEEAGFRVVVTEVKEEELPQVDDDFAQHVQADTSSVEELRDRIRTDLKARAEEDARRDLENRAIDALVEMSEVTFPPVLVDAEMHQLIEGERRRFERQGLTLEQFLRSVDKTEEDLRREVQPLAELRTVRGLVLGRLYEEERIQVGDADIDAEVADILKDAPEDRKEELEKALGAPEARESVRQTLITRKAIDRLVDIARAGEAVAPQKEEE